MRERSIAEVQVEHAEGRAARTATSEMRLTADATAQCISYHSFLNKHEIEVGAFLCCVYTRVSFGTARHLNITDLACGNSN